MRTFTASGIILHRTLLGESDKILTIYTKEFGKLSAVAKGARKAGSRLSGATELFTSARFFFAKGKSLDIVSQCEIVNSYPGLKHDLDRMARATYLCELLDRLTISHDQTACEELHNLTEAALGLLQRSEAYLDGVVHAFELHLMAELGYAPVLGRCVRCGCKTEGETVAFSSTQGGELCTADRKTVRDATPLSREALTTMEALRDSDAEDMLHIRPSTRVASEIARTLRWYISQRLDRQLKSAVFLDEIRSYASP